MFRVGKTLMMIGDQISLLAHFRPVMQMIGRSVTTGFVPVAQGFA